MGRAELSMDEQHSRRAELPMDEQHKAAYHGVRGGPVSV